MLMEGHTLVIALSRTSGEIEVTDRYNRVTRMSPSDSIHLVCDSECYVGKGSKRRVRSIFYRLPKPRPVVIQDSGFEGFNRYPLADQRTSPEQIFKIAA